MANLGQNYKDVGRLDEAIALLGSGDAQKVSGEAGPRARGHITVHGQLSSGLRRRREISLKAALPLLEEKLRLSKETLGPEHPNTLSSMNNLANGYQHAGRLGEALPLLEEVVRLEKEKLGPEHSHTLLSMNSLGVLYQDTGQYDKALALHEQAVELFRKTLGPEHGYTLVAMDSPSHAYLNTGRHTEAVSLHEELLKGWQKAMGPDHPETLKLFRCLGEAQYRERQSSEGATAAEGIA